MIRASAAAATTTDRIFSLERALAFAFVAVVVVSAQQLTTGSDYISATPKTVYEAEELSPLNMVRIL